MTMTDGIDQEPADVLPAAPKSLVRLGEGTEPNPLPMTAACALEELVSAAAEDLKREASLSATVCKTVTLMYTLRDELKEALDTMTAAEKFDLAMKLSAEPRLQAMEDSFPRDKFVECCVGGGMDDALAILISGELG